MTNRRHEVVVIACTLAALAGFAACSEDAPTVASGEVVGEWAGTTSQQRELGFVVTSEGISQGAFGYQMSGQCNFNVEHDLNASDAIDIAGGKFTTGKTQIGTGVGGGAFVTITGEFTSSTTAKGTFLIQHAPCGDTLNITWTANKQ